MAAWRAVFGLRRLSRMFATVSENAANRASLLSWSYVRGRTSIPMFLSAVVRSESERKLFALLCTRVLWHSTSRPSSQYRSQRQKERCARVFALLDRLMRLLNESPACPSPPRWRGSPSKMPARASKGDAASGLTRLAATRSRSQPRFGAASSAMRDSSCAVVGAGRVQRSVKQPLPSMNGCHPPTTGKRRFRTHVWSASLIGCGAW